MKFDDLIKILNFEYKIRYYSNLEKTTYEMEKDGDFVDIQSRTMQKLFRNYNYEIVPYGIEGNEETGFIKIGVKKK